MQFNKQRNDLIESDRKCRTVFNYTPTTTTSIISTITTPKETETETESEREIESNLPTELSAKKIKNIIKQHGTSEIDKYGEASVSCTSSTDSGVNISDNDEISYTHSTLPLHSYHHSHSYSHSHPFASQAILSTETTTANTFNKQFSRTSNNNNSNANNNNNNRNTNHDNNIKNKSKNSNNNKSKNNNGNNHMFNDDDHNYDNDDDVGDDDSDEVDESNSTNFDTELKSEQLRKQQQQLTHNFSKTENNSSGDNYSRYQANQSNQNVIESENAINIKRQQNVTTPRLTLAVPTTATAATTTPNTEILSLEQNEFIKPPKQSTSKSLSRSLSPTSSPSASPSPSPSSFPSPSPSLSTSSRNSYTNVPPSKMHTCRSSPAVSIRSIDSTIISSDSDSDSDLNGDIEGEHENYVIKKLGTQVTYPPNHPDIPNINRGHKILNQHVTLTDDPTPPSPLLALAAVGDRIGAAQALGTVPANSAIVQRPQIGSIALSNSSDVTFGDKHFYEGPVTIQQFLIDGYSKWKDNDGQNNPTSMNENLEYSNNNAKDINSSTVQSGKLYGYITKRKKIIIPAVLAVLALLVVATILGSKQWNNTKNTNSSDAGADDSECSGNGQDNVGSGYVLRIVPRSGWLAQPPINPWVPLDLPVERIVVIPTRTTECETQAACTYTVRFTQTFNIESQQQDDIIYNFLIGGDGNVYEGRGWDNRGSVLKGFNEDSISFAYIGAFKKQPPSYKQLNVTKLLIQEGVRLNKLSSNYRIVGANQLDPVSIFTSADALYKSFENWPHWSNK